MTRRSSFWSIQNPLLQANNCSCWARASAWVAELRMVLPHLAPCLAYLGPPSLNTASFGTINNYLIDNVDWIKALTNICTLWGKDKMRWTIDDKMMRWTTYGLDWQIQSWKINSSLSTHWHSTQVSALNLGDMDINIKFQFYFCHQWPYRTFLSQRT